MSWISEFAGKAENFLNKIDQNAAVALNSTSGDLDAISRSRSRPSTVLPQESEENMKISNYSARRAHSKDNSLNVDDNDKVDGNIAHDSPKIAASFSHSKSQRAKPPRKTQPRQIALDPELAVPSVNGHFQMPNKTSDAELLNFLNSPDQKEIDVNSLLKTELDTQRREMSLLLLNNRKLQKDYDNLKKSAEPNSNSSKHGNPRVENEVEKLRDQKHLEDQIAEKSTEIDRLTERLQQALEKLEQTGELQSGQNRIQFLEKENRQLSTQCQDLMSSVEKSTAQIAISELHSKNTKEALTYLEKEFSSYKDKAKIILKSKDEIIASIKAQTRNEDEAETDYSASTESQFLSEIGSLRNERELLHAEITQSRSYIESIRDESNRIEEEVQSLRINNSNLQKLLSKEKQKSDLIQEENLQLSQEMANLQLLFERERIEGRKLQEKWEKLYDQNSNSVMSLASGITKSSSLSDFSASVGRNLMQNSGYSDMDETENLRTRITALSQSLLEKQSQINNLSSDKQMLQIRCERLQGQLDELNCNPDSLDSGDSTTNSVVSSQPLYLIESPWDSRMATRVKRAYSTMDSFCCQIGLLLRQRPNLRLGFCVYILCLHLWVFLILFTWAHHTSVSGNPETK